MKVTGRFIFVLAMSVLLWGCQGRGGGTAAAPDNIDVSKFTAIRATGTDTSLIIIQNEGAAKRENAKDKVTAKKAAKNSLSVNIKGALNTVESESRDAVATIEYMGNGKRGFVFTGANLTQGMNIPLLFRLTQGRWSAVVSLKNTQGTLLSSDKVNVKAELVIFQRDAKGLFIEKLRKPLKRGNISFNLDASKTTALVSGTFMPTDTFIKLDIGAPKPIAYQAAVVLTATALIPSGPNRNGVSYAINAALEYANLQVKQQ